MIELIDNPEEIKNESSNNNESGEPAPVQETVAEEQSVPVETEITPEPVIAEGAPTNQISVEEQEAKVKEQEAKAKEQAEKKARMDVIFTELKELKASEATLEVEVISRIKGGLRVIYKNLQLFLPASHFTIKRTPTEEELQEAIGAKFNVTIHEIQEMEDGRKAVIVTRKNLLVSEFWNNIEVGKIVSGKITSVASFGVFIDLGGIEGLIHISRLSQTHIDDPTKLYKKGDSLEAKIIEINKESNRIGLSRKELEPSPWDGIDSVYAPNTIHKGIVRRITDFGVYVELQSGIDGLLRTPEISWTKRIKHPSEIFTAGQEIDVEVMTINTEKQTIALSYKRTQPNPWSELSAKYPIGTVINGVVSQVLPQGAIISIEDLDGFMPKSKIKSLSKGKKMPFEVGETIEVKIADIVPEQESVIFEPAVQEIVVRPQRSERFSTPNPKDTSGSAISFMDMLSEDAKAGLINNAK